MSDPKIINERDLYSFSSSATATSMVASGSREHGGSMLLVTTSVVLSLMGPITLGYSLGFTSPTQSEIVSRFNMGKSDWSLFSSLLLIGAMVGSVFVGAPLMNAYGRRTTAILGALPYIFGYLMLGLGRSVWVLLLSRFIIGIATGMVSLAVPVYIAEIAPAAKRGMFGALNQMGITGGILLAYSLGLTDLSWKVLALIGIVPSCILGIGLLFMPESPAWLMTNRSASQARSALHRFRGRHANIEEELEELESALHYSRHLRGQPAKVISYDGRDEMPSSAATSAEDTPLLGAVSEIQRPLLERLRFSLKALCRRTVLWPLIISVMMMAAQQISGVNAVTMFAGSIFADANYDNANLAAVYIGLVEFFTSGLSSWLVDRLGRRTLLISSATGLAFSCALLGGFFFVRESAGIDDDIPLGWLALLSLLLYIFFFSIGVGPVPWFLMSEILPNDIRSTLSSIAILTNWGLSFLVAQTYQSLVDSIGKSYTFWFYGCFNIWTFIFVLLFVPETKGRSLAEIELIFNPRGRSTSKSDSV